MSSPQPATIGEEKELLKNDKEANKAVFHPEVPAHRYTWQQRLARRLKIRNQYARIVLAEFLGTFVLGALGTGALAQAILHKPEHEGNIVTIIIGWGMAVAMGVYMCGGVTGGHINPAVTTAMVLLGRVPLVNMVFYWLGQYLGALFSSFCVWVVYFDALNRLDDGNRVSMAATFPYHNKSSDLIWATYPKEHVTVEQGFADQIFSTCLLVLLAMAITDERNMNVPKGMIPIVIGFGVVGILTGYAANCSAAMNPARDLSPRIFVTIAGWGTGPFTFRHGAWWWVPILGPHVGAIVGALLYNICVGLHWPEPVHRYA